MPYILVCALIFACGFVAGVAVTILVQDRLSKPWVKIIQVPRPASRSLPRGVRRSAAPDIRRIANRPVNKDEPPSVVRQALFRQHPLRRLHDEDK